MVPVREACHRTSLVDLGKFLVSGAYTFIKKQGHTHIYIYIRIHMIIYKKNVCIYNFTYAVRTLQNVLYSLRLKI